MAGGGDHPLRPLPLPLLLSLLLPLLATVGSLENKTRVCDVLIGTVLHLDNVQCCTLHEMNFKRQQGFRRRRRRAQRLFHVV